MTAFWVLLCTIFGLYCIGVAINAYHQFSSEDIDWDEIGKQVQEDMEEVEIHTEVENTQPFIIHKTNDLEEWDLVEYTENMKQAKPKTGKDLKLEIND